MGITLAQIHVVCHSYDIQIRSPGANLCILYKKLEYLARKIGDLLPNILNEMVVQYTDTCFLYCNVGLYALIVLEYMLRAIE